MSVAFETTRPGSRARAISSARNRAPGTSARAPSAERTSKGPSIPICTTRFSHPCDGTVVLRLLAWDGILRAGADVGDETRWGVGEVPGCVGGLRVGGADRGR